MLVVSVATVWGWHILLRPDPLQTQLVASLAPLPAALTPAQLDVLRQRSSLSPVVITQTQQQLSAASLPVENLNGWYQGMTTLQKLSNNLNGLDEQKGKYMTVSELKSVVFSAMQSFNQSIPAEE